jgi:flavin-dependent thymidylate synthase
MYKAEDIKPEDGPRVYLLWMTPDPLGAIAAACKMYKGEVVRDLATVTDAERVEYLQQITKTKLQAPFEFVKFHFLIEGVTRAFTHQMVRQRTAVYAQESMRFAVKETMPVALPPSLAGTDLPDDWRSTVDAGLADDNDWFGRYSDAEKMRVIWEDTKERIEEGYNALIRHGMPAEDARGLAPTNVLTRLHYSTDLRALLDHAGNRLCTQAQFEWRLVFTRIVEAIRAVDMQKDIDWAQDVVRRASGDEGFQLQSGMTTADLANGTNHVYKANALADLFRPVCYATGKCEFMANFDRECKIRDRVQANHRHGIPSSQWGEFKVAGDPPGEEDIPGIQPSEWLMDPGAAR